MPSAELETRNPKLETDLREIAQDIVRRAMAGGATAAECVVREGDEFSTLVRLGQVETLKESGSKSIGVRVFFGQRAASTYSSDFSARGARPDGEVGVNAVRRSPRKIRLAEFRKLRNSARSRAISICITATFIRSRVPIASTTHGARKRLRSILIRASRTRKADRSTRRPATRFWPIRTGSLANIAGLTVPSQPCP